MQGRLISKPWSIATRISTIKVDQSCQLRHVVSKAPDRAAVHGLRLPTADTVNKDELEKEINKLKEEKEEKRKEVEKAVDSKKELPYVKDRDLS